MLMRTYQHDCKTTFVNGINPFVMAAAFMPAPAPKPTPQVNHNHIGRPPILQLQIFALLSDRKPRTSREIALELDRHHKSVVNVLRKLAKAGFLSKVMKKRELVRPVTCYSLWREKND